MRAKLAKTSKEERYKRRVRAFQDRIEVLQAELEDTRKERNQYNRRLAKLEAVIQFMCGKFGWLKRPGVRWDDRLVGHEETILTPWATLEEARAWAKDKLVPL